MPSITVIVPTCQRAKMLERCLRALPAEAQVIVTDDSADEATREMLARNFPAIRWLAGPRRGPAANRNCGARAAATEWIAFLDDDCIPQPGWLAALAKDSSAVVREGRTVCPDASDDPFVETVENLTGGNYWSCNLAVRRETFFALGGFDEDFTEAGGEDMEFAWRIRRGGLEAGFVPEAEVLHPARHGSWGLLWRRTLMLRWMVLYRIKTGDAPALGSSLAHAGCSLVLRETMELLRLTVHAVTRRDSQRPRSQVFHVVKRWVTFPLLIPWLLVWNYRFRKLLGGQAMLGRDPKPYRVGPFSK